MAAFGEKVKSFIFKKQDSEIEFSNDLLALLRLGCFSSILFCIVNCIILYNVFHSNISVIVLLGVFLAFSSVLFISYFQRKSFIITLYLYCILVMGMLTLLARLFGAQIGYHLGILCLIFVLFYHTGGGKGYRYARYFMAILMSIYSFVLWYVIILNGAILPVSKQDTFLLSLFYMCWSGFSIINIAWFYHYKFTKDEDDLLKYTAKLKDLSRHDALTKLQNRRGIMDNVGKLLKVTCGGLFFVMCDIDYFKTVNDSYGHDIGDKVLARIAEIISEALTKQSFVGRWGGEEFLIVISHSTQQEVLDLIESIRWKIEKEVFEITETKKFKVTMTFGISEHYFGQNTVEESIKLADENLYKGKENGRNCVIF